MNPSLLRKTLSNGLRVIFAHQPGALAATIAILVEAGSEYEAKRMSGISHFLEHLVFKGTTSRPRPGAISLELESLGADYNALTSQEYTMYYAKAEKRKLDRILELTADMYLNPVFNAAEIEKERGVIMEEINLYEDTPHRRVQDLFSELLYGDQPAGWDVAGKKETIRRLSRADFVGYRRKHYVAPATAIVVAGSFNQNQVWSQIKSLFGDLPRARKPGKPEVLEKQKRPAVKIQFKESKQSHLVLGVRAFDIFDSRRYALRVMGHVLGGGMSSRLFMRIREEMGAAYYVRAEEELLRDHGYFAVSSGVDVKRIQDVIDAVLVELRRLRTEPVGAQELRKAKDHLLGNLVLGLEGSDDLAAFYGGQEILTGQVVDLKTAMARVDAVTAPDILKVAGDILRNDRLNLAVIGPYKKAEHFRRSLGI